jgi:hypothetical protein
VITDVIEVCGTDVTLKANEKKAKRYNVTNCSDMVMHSINPSDEFTAMLTKLHATYGFGNIDPSVILAKLRTISFHTSKDPTLMLNQIDIWLNELDSAGGAIEDS